jgi:hypothetical protein
MSDSPAPNHPNLAAQLPPNSYHYLIHTLSAALPLLPTDNPEDLALRDQAAIDRVASLCPANTAEAEIAALHVAACEHAKECLRLAMQPESGAPTQMKCRVQARGMMREAQGFMRLLLRMQAVRQKRDANSETRESAAWAEHCAKNLMTEALSPVGRKTPNLLRGHSVTAQPAVITTPPAAPSIHRSRPADMRWATDPEPTSDPGSLLPGSVPEACARALDPRVGSPTEPGDGPPAGAPNRAEEPKLATPKPDARARVLRALDDWGYESPTAQLATLTRLIETLDNPQGDLVQSLSAALLPPPTTPDGQPAEP